MLGHRDQAKQILDRHWDGSLPVGIRVICIKMGLKVERRSLLDGVVADLEPAQDVILIDTHLTEPVSRFAMAHVLAHRVLELPFSPEKREHFMSAVGGYEQMANDFAGRVLVPDQALDYLVHRRGITDIKTMAEMLQVSEALIGHRVGQCLI